MSDCCNYLSEGYTEGHFLSGVDARVKLIITFGLLTMVLSADGILFPLLTAASCLFICARMRVPLRLVMLRFSEPLFIAFMALVLKTFFSGSTPIFTVNLFSLKITAYNEGLSEGLRIVCRVTGAVSLIITLGVATPFTGLMAGLSWIRVPRPLIEIALFAYRYIFVFLEDALIIYNAQKNRLGYSSMRKGLNSFGILAGSLVLRGFEQSQKTAESMLLRGYTGDIPYLKNRPFKALEVVAAATVLIFAATVWII